MDTKPKKVSFEQTTKTLNGNQRNLDHQTSYKSILESITDAIILIDQNGTIDFVNQQTKELFGYEQDELIGQKVEVLIPERFHHQHINHRNNYSTKPEIRQMGIGMDLFARHKDGTEFPCEVGLSPMKTADGDYVICGLQDISIRKQAEQFLLDAHKQLEKQVQERTKALTKANVKLKNEISARNKAEKLSRDSEARFRMIYESAPVMIDAFDANGRCYMWNKECEKVLGWTAEEIFAHEDPIKLFYPDPQIRQKVVDTITLTPGSEFIEWRPKRKDGSEAICLWANFKFPDGKIISIGHDITEKKQAEEEATIHRERLAHLVRVQTLGEMASGIAHEINQPLAAIDSYAQASQKHLQSRETNLGKVEELVEKISIQARRAGSVVSRLRSMMQNKVSNPLSLDINQLLNEVSEIAKIGAKNNNCNLILKYSHSLPKVICDEIQIQQVALNLISNAVDAMDELEGDVEKNINVETRIKDNNYLEVCVSDNGSGINVQDMNKIFEAFYTTKDSGLGMGLSICKSIIENHGGELGCSQNETGGSSFCFSLPVEK